MNRDRWARRAILNVADSGISSVNRTIAQYAAVIWNAKTLRDSLKGVHR